MESPTRDTTTVDLIRDLVADVRLLVRQSVSLGRAELRESLEQLAAVAALLALTAGLLGAAGLWILVGVTQGVAVLFGWPVWAVCAGIGLVLAAVGLVLAAIVREQLAALDLFPKSRKLSHALLDGSLDGLRRHPR